MDGTVRIDRLGLEDEFVYDFDPIPAWNLPANPKLGRLIDIGVGSVLVEINDVRVRWAPEVHVIPVAKFESESEEPSMATAAVTPNPVAQNLVTRFRMQLNMLQKGSEGQKNTAIERIPKLLEESLEKSVQLPDPSGMGFSAVVEANPELFAEYPFAEVTQDNAAQPKLVPKQTKAQKGESDAAAAVQTAKAKAVAKKEAKPAREKKVIEPHPCLDGCGATLTTAGRFRPGHDAKLKSIIQKVERGELSTDDIPEPAQDLIKFKKGDVVTEKDDKGKVTSKVQTWICTESPVKLPGRS